MRIFIAALAALGFATTLAAAEKPAASPAAPATTIEMQVDGLVCGFCAQGIEKTLRKEASTADVYVNLERRLVAVALKPQQDIADERLKALLTDSGYTVRSVKRTAEPLAVLRARSEAQ